MPLTRHLYELDEVVSALQTCLRNHWPRGPFWVWELLQSGEAALALSTLREAWLSWGGGHDPAIMSLAPKSDEDWVRLTLRIYDAIHAAGSLNAVTLLRRTAAIGMRPTVTPRPRRGGRVAERRRTGAAAFVAALEAEGDVVMDRADAANWWISFDAACRQGLRTDAVWLLQAAQPVFCANVIWAALCIAGRGGLSPIIAELQTAMAGDAHPVKQALAQANATLMLCTRGADARAAMLRPAEPTPVGFTLRDWTTWNSRVGRRVGRLHPIPQDALHTGTTRGGMSKQYTNIDEIREPVVLLTEACAYWRAATKAAGIEEDAETGAIVFPDDDVLEAFHDQHFPDDIPDEWSRADQRKSHGEGCAETAPAPPPAPAIREEPVCLRVWRMATHVRW